MFEIVVSLFTITISLISIGINFKILLDEKIPKSITGSGISKKYALNTHAIKRASEIINERKIKS